MSIDVKEAGRKGGNCTKNRYGLTFYSQIGSKGGKVTAERYRDKYTNWGKMGGRPKLPDLNSSGGGGLS